MTSDSFKFPFSLTVLNHLGRGLYRNFATLLAEAISNSWDADARNVYIHIDIEKKSFSIKDDGIGMSSEDFQDKFLKIGYSKRKGGNTKSIGRRPYIGRKGIGKLALLSCAEKISIFSKKENMDKYISGVIDNSELDEVIKKAKGKDEQSYSIHPAKHNLITSLKEKHNFGTIIVFEGFNKGMSNTLDNLKKVIALYFKFSLLDKNFNIYINDQKITEKTLEELATNTQFLWKINDIQDSYYRLVEGKILKERQRQLDEGMEEDKARPRPKEMPFSFEKDEMSYDITGFIASVKKPRNLSITGLSEKVTIDVFANGRLRQRDIISENTQIGANYLYGQIHFNQLDEGDDRSTTSREGIKEGDELYDNFKEEFEKGIISKIIHEWVKLRKEYEDETDKNRGIEKRTKKAYDETSEIALIDFPDAVKNELDDKLKEDAKSNQETYINAFIIETYLRDFIYKNNIPFEDYKVRNYRNYRSKAIKYQDEEEKNENDMVIEELVENEEEEKRKLLKYLGAIDLMNIINEWDEEPFGLGEKRQYMAIRNAMAHMRKLTNEAKGRMATILKNLKKRLNRLSPEENQSS